MGKSIDLSLNNIWLSWLHFKKAKRQTVEFHIFKYNLEKELHKLCTELNNGSYKHDGYKKFMVNESKRREICVAPIRDRVVHRLLYDYLVPIYDKTFICDVWSCRKDKGLLGAIQRTQQFLQKYPNSYVWRADVEKFFDTVDHDILLKILTRKIKDPKAFGLLREVVKSFSLSHKTINGGGALLAYQLGI